MYGFIEGFKQGFIQGIRKSNFDMAIKVKKEYGIELASRISGFSRQELESETLNE